MIGELLDHYRVLELIGRGAMGVVYKGLDVNLDRQVAIKVMSVEARNDPDFVERFRQEARLQGALNHPNVAILFDYFVHDGTPVAVMEFIDGESLEEMIRARGAISPSECIPLFKQALRGVAAAHRAGIIHRDLKPSNLMVTKDGAVKVMDFGIAKRQGSPGATKVASTSIGSPLYMAPEQILGRAVDCRTDVYALGLTLYELVSGHRPFNPRGKAEYMVLNAHVNDQPEPPTVYRLGIPQPIVDAVMRALAKDPAARFQSADEFMSALPDMPAAFAADPRVGTGTEAPPRSGTVALPRTGTVALPRTGTMALPRTGPTGTMALPRSGPTGTVALQPAPASNTVAVEFSPATGGDSVDFCLPDETGKPESGAPAPRTAAHTMMFDYSAQTLLHEPAAHARPADASTVPSAAAHDEPVATAGFIQRLRDHRLGVAVVLVAIVALAALARHPGRPLTVLPTNPLAETPIATPAAASVERAPASVASGEASEASAPPPTDAAAVTETTAAAEGSSTIAPPAAPALPVRHDLTGNWSGSYVDGTGRQRLRVVSLSISRVQEDGGIEGTLRYQAASGNGECQLHPRGSSYSKPAQRLQLSPEGCSAHYPKELGVPLDFDGVNPQANTLRNGRIEAPTGELIHVRLQRLNGF